MKIKYPISYLALIVAAILWGTTYPVVKIGLSVLSPPLPPLGYLFLRFTLALIVLIPIMPVFASLNDLKFLLTNKLIIFMGVINGGTYILQFLGQKGTTAGIATLMMNTYLISTPLLTSIYLRIKISRELKISIGLGCIGVVISATSVIISDVLPQNLGSFLISTGIVLVSGLIWGGYSVISNKFYQKSENNENLSSSNPISVFFISNVYSITLITISMGIFNQIPNFNEITSEGWISVIYLGIVCTTTAFILYIYASKSISPAVISVILLLNIIIGLILSTLILGDSFSIYMTIGSIIIIVAVYLAGKAEYSKNLSNLPSSE